VMIPTSSPVMSTDLLPKRFREGPESMQKMNMNTLAGKRISPSG